MRLHPVQTILRTREQSGPQDAAFNIIIRGVPLPTRARSTTSHFPAFFEVVLGGSKTLALLWYSLFRSDIVKITCHFDDMSSIDWSWYPDDGQVTRCEITGGIGACVPLPTRVMVYFPKQNLKNYKSWCEVGVLVLCDKEMLLCT